MTAIHLWLGWCAILAGMIAGALQGLFFHRPEWLGGYPSWRRRLTRLGHISFFGLGFINLAWAVTVERVALISPRFSALWWGSVLLGLGTVLMPVLCYSSAWRESFRRLFFLPVACLVGAVGILVLSGAFS